MNSFDSQRGFTLTEILIAVAIIGVLAALAIPRFMPSTGQAKQSEARQILKQVYVMQRAHHQEEDTYACNGATASASNPNGFVALGVQIMSSARYTYTLAADSSTFTCTATANLDDDATIDTWTVDESGTVTNTIDDRSS